MGRRSIIVVEDFYDNPKAMRQYALTQRYYLPYQDEENVMSGKERPLWWASLCKSSLECPFKSSKELIQRLEDATEEHVDMTYWNTRYPTNNLSKPMIKHPDAKNSSLWNCCFHVKMDNNQRLGQGVHNHVIDKWNSVGEDGWTGLIYLSEDAPLEGGLQLWKNIDQDHIYDWMTPPENWVLIDRFANIYNRLLLVRGNIPHSGANGWGHDIHTGRMFQTFFFKTTNEPKNFSVKIDL